MLHCHDEKDGRLTEINGSCFQISTSGRELFGDPTIPSSTSQGQGIANASQMRFPNYG